MGRNGIHHLCQQAGKPGEESFRLRTMGEGRWQPAIKRTKHGKGVENKGRGGHGIRRHLRKNNMVQSLRLKRMYTHKCLQLGRQGGGARAVCGPRAALLESLRCGGTAHAAKLRQWTTTGSAEKRGGEDDGEMLLPYG